MSVQVLGKPGHGSWYTVDGLTFFDFMTHARVMDFVDAIDANEVWELIMDPATGLVTPEQSWEIWSYQTDPMIRPNSWRCRYAYAPPEDVP